MLLGGAQTIVVFNVLCLRTVAATTDGEVAFVYRLLTPNVIEFLTQTPSVHAVCAQYRTVCVGVLTVLQAFTRARLAFADYDREDRPRVLLCYAHLLHVLEQTTPTGKIADAKSTDDQAQRNADTPHTAGWGEDESLCTVFCLQWMRDIARKVGREHSDTPPPQILLTAPSAPKVLTPATLGSELGRTGFFCRGMACVLHHGWHGSVARRVAAGHALAALVTSGYGCVRGGGVKVPYAFGWRQLHRGKICP